MLHILGIGHAYPEAVVSNDLLAELGADVPGDVPGGITTRHTVLPLEYIRTSGANPEDAEKVASHSPTDLTEEATKVALDRAGISVEDLGLILGGASVPKQTTPSEAQRLGKRLGVKIPAYDVYSASGDFALHTSVLHRWREERVPDYVLCISANTPTLRVNYREGSERFYLGDAASAVVLSPRHRGKLSVCAASYNTDPSKGELMRIKLYGHAEFQVEPVSQWMEERLEANLKESLQVDATDTFFVGNQFDLPLLERVAERVGIDSSRHWHNAEHVGCSLGSSPVTVLSERWDEVAAGAYYSVCSAGIGMSDGFVALKGEN